MDKWLTSLQTSDPQSGFELAIKLSRMAVGYTQSNMEKLEDGRSQYEDDAGFLIAASQVIATNFQTVAAANNYWKEN